jgi:hypothetical protein
MNIHFLGIGINNIAMMKNRLGIGAFKSKAEGEIEIGGEISPSSAQEAWEGAADCLAE